jgi:hypothetical protein
MALDYQAVFSPKNPSCAHGRKKGRNQAKRATAGKSSCPTGIGSGKLKPKEMFKFHRILIAYAVAIPLALVLGYLVATPDIASIAVVGMVLSFLVLPLLIQHVHWLLIFTWNSAFIVSFLPGSMPIWIVFACLTLGMGLVNLVMGHRRFLRAPELTRPILLLTAVVLLTAKIRGGVGLRVLGSGVFGGKKYFYVLTAIIGYFALTSQPIPTLTRARTVEWFFLSSLSQGLGNLVYFLGPAFYFMYFFVPSGSAVGQASADFQEGIVKRYGGLGPCATGLFCFMLASWGLRGIFAWTKPWRLILLAIVIAGSLFSGFRSQFIFLMALFAIQFMMEGLWRTSLLPIMVLLGVLCLAPVLLFANRMPEAVQRSLAFLPVDLGLPVEIDPNARAEAEGSSGWRFELWRVAWPEVPQYLLIGKGYALDPTEMYLTDEAVRRGLVSNYEVSLFAGDYHNGPLSVLIPFGIFGAIAFLWLLGSGVKVLYCNHRYGDTRMKLVNTLLLSYFLTQCLFFLVVFGGLESGLAPLLGTLALSVSLNGGVCRRQAPKAVPGPVAAAVRLQPA